MSRTLLLGLDGATFSVLDPLMESGVMPELKALCARGARARLLSTPNPLTPAAWTSLATGRTPGHHGVFDFVRVEQAGGQPHFRLATSSDIGCDTLWSMLGKLGRRSICLNFPVMFPPRPIEGFLIPGFVPQRHLRQAMYPPALHERLRQVPGIDLRELAVDFEEERRSVQVLARDRYEDWIRFHIRRERQWFEVLRHLMETEAWDLAAVVFDGVDKLQHICWRFIDDGLFPQASASLWERRVRELCLDYFRQLDELIARSVELAGDETRVFLASDHGFGPSDEIFYVNTWLADRGLLAWRDGVPLAEEGMLNPEGMKNPSFLFDWERTRAYTLTPGSNGIYLRSPGGGAGSAAPERAALRRRLAEELLELRSPVCGEPVVRRAMTRDEAFPGPLRHLAPDLTLVLRDHGFVSVLRSEVAVKARREIAGAHRPHGIFVAHGPGVRQGATLADLSIIDVTPALVYSLGLTVPESFEGRLPEEVFESGQLARRPARIASHDPGRSPGVPVAAGLAAMDAQGEETVLNRLRSLGYLE